MPTEVPEPPVHLNRILRRYAVTMDQLDFEYAKSVPNSPPGEFKEDFFIPLCQLIQQLPSVSAILDDRAVLREITEEFLKRKKRIELDVWFIYLSCAHATAAKVALERHEQNLAWDLLYEAGLMLGGVMVINRDDEVLFNDMLNIHKATFAKQNAYSRHKQTNAIKTRVYEIMRAGSSWISQASAVQIVANMLIEECGKDCLKDFEGTITGWIKAMPDRLDLIPSLRVRLK